MRTSRLISDIGIGVLASAVVGGLHVVLSPRLGIASSYPTLLAALTLVAWFRGLRAAVITLAMEGLVLATALPPVGRLELDAQGWANLAWFLAIGLTIALVIEGLHVARRRAEVSAGEARDRQEVSKRAEELSSHLASIVESSDDAIIGKTLEGVITSWNAGAERLYGYSAAEMVGRPIAPLMPAEQTGELASIMARLERGERIDHYETLRVRKDGRRVSVSVTISPIHDSQGKVIGASAIARDITDRKRAERFRNARLVVSQVLANAPSLKEATPRVLQAVGQALGWSFGAIWWVDRDEGVLRCVGAWHEPTRALPEFLATTESRTFLPGVGLPGRVWKRHAPIWIHDVAHDDNFPRAPLAEREGLHSALAYPVTGAGEVLGVIEFVSSHIQEPDAETLEVLAVVSNQLGLFIERRVAEDLLRKSELELSDFFDNATLGLHWVGPDGIVLRVNRAELEMLGYAREEYVGRPIADFHVDREVIDDIHRRLAAGEVVHNREARMRCRDGSIRHVLIDSSVLWAGSRFVHTRCFTRDVTEQKRAEADLQAAVQELAEADRKKNEFLATLAHELRNPLAPIRNALEIMSRAGDDPVRRMEAQTVMERQMEQMVRLVDDLLDVSRITRGRVELRKERVELGTILQDAVEISRPLIDASRHELILRIPEIAIEVDPTRMAQVFANLLNNAAKYTEPGGRIWLTAERRGSEAWIAVKDTGIGIAAEAVPRVFDMFTQVASTDRGGLGIGLALVQRLVGMHGGSVSCFSEGPGKGSEFVVRLPLATEAPKVEDVPRPPVAVASGHSRRILVVDDNQDSADSLAMMLEMQAHTTHTVYDGKAALDAFAVFDPEVIVLDIGMARLTGLDTAREIRRRPRGSEVVLIAMTGWGQEEDKDKAREAGFDHYLTKPVHPDALLRLLAGLSQQPA